MAQQSNTSSTPIVLPTTAELESLLPYLTPRERGEMDHLLSTVALPIWSATAGPQEQAHRSLADITGYGGAAGAGKSDVIVGVSLTTQRDSLILRREFPQLKHILRRFDDLVGVDRRNKGDKLISTPDGRTIEYGSMAYDGDEQKYRGRPHDFIGFDEAEQFPEAQVRFVMTWLRTTIVGQRTRVIMGFNPPMTAEGEWIIEFFGPWLNENHPHPAIPGELRWYAMVDGEEIAVDSGAAFTHDGELIEPKSRTFIPGRVENNPYLMRTSYKRELQSLTEPFRSIMLLGNFRAGRGDHPRQVIPSDWVRAAQARWRARAKPNEPLSAAGFDAALGGKAKAVLALRYGNYYDKLIVFDKNDGVRPEQIAQRIVMELPHNATVFVDAAGVGYSITSSLRLIAQSMDAVETIFAGKSHATDRTGKFKFYNVRAELIWKMFEALDPNTGDDLALPDDPELLADLCSARWELKPRGILIEDKEDIVKRLRRSPDRGEAVILALQNDESQIAGFIRSRQQ